MRRTMELISLFDSDALASQRVKLFEVKNGSPTDIAKELDTVFRSMSLGEKASAGEVHAARIGSTPSWPWRPTPASSKRWTSG